MQPTKISWDYPFKRTSAKYSEQSKFFILLLKYLQLVSKSTTFYLNLVLERDNFITVLTNLLSRFVRLFKSKRKRKQNGNDTKTSTKKDENKRKRNWDENETKLKRKRIKTWGKRDEDITKHKRNKSDKERKRINTYCWTA